MSRIAAEQLGRQAETRQDVLQRFVGHFAVVGNLFEPVRSDEELRARLAATAYSLVDEGGFEGPVVDLEQDPIIELRPLLPTEALKDDELSERREKVISDLSDVLYSEYGVSTSLNTHPITPTERASDPVSPERTWSAIGAELDGLEHQMAVTPQHQLAMLAITQPSYAEHVFKGQTFFNVDRLKYGTLMILGAVGDEPRDNLLLAPDRTGILDARQINGLRLPNEEAAPY
jgi:hypothetical protein